MVGLIPAVARYVMLVSSLIVVGKNNFLENFCKIIKNVVSESV